VGRVAAQASSSRRQAASQRAIATRRVSASLGSSVGIVRARRCNSGAAGATRPAFVDILRAMQIKPPGLFSRGRLTLSGPFPHITPDSLLQELLQQWGPRGFTAYKSSLPMLDVALKKSGWTGVAIKIKQSPTETTLVYNAFSPSMFVRMLQPGLIPLLIVSNSSWKPLLRAFEQYVQGSPFYGGSMQLQQPMQGQLGMPPQQGAPMHPQGAPMHQQGAPMQQQAAPQQHGAPAQQYPCPRCQSPLQWAAQYQRWFCARCQQYA
jgi:hypothetical protein